MKDRMLDVLDVMNEFHVSRPTVIKEMRVNKGWHARKLGNKWIAPKSAIYGYFGLAGEFNEPVKDKMLTKDQFCKLANISIPTLQKLIHSDELTIGVTLGRNWRVSMSQACEWLNLQYCFVEND